MNILLYCKNSNKHIDRNIYRSMIITLDLQRFILSNLFFLDMKRNIIMDGSFTKLIYSNDAFTMNGLYILFPIENNGVERIMNKTQVKFNPYSPHNLQIVQDFSKLEVKILEYYRQSRQCGRKISNLLSKQMYVGFMKIHRDSYDMSNELKKNIQYVIKISGVWETRDEIGLTYKLYEVSEVYS